MGKKERIRFTKEYLRESRRSGRDFLNEMIQKHGKNSDLSRNDIGYAPLTQQLLQSGFLNIDEYDVIDMDITIPIYAYATNPYGIVKIGNQIIQFKHNVIKRITDGNASKIEALLSASQTRIKENIIVEDISRSRINHSSSLLEGSKTLANTSCEDINDNYRLIAYEERVGIPLDTWCSIDRVENWYLRLRSLKKVLGTWQNHKTGYLQVVSNNVTMAHYWIPKESYSNLSTATLVSTFANEVNVVHNLPYGHTAEYYYIHNYPLKCYPPPNPSTHCSIIYSPSYSFTAKAKTKLSVTSVEARPHTLGQFVHCS